MVDPDILARRILALHEALQRLAQSGGEDAMRLRSDATLRAAVERWLQVAIEACIDMAFHVVAERGWTPPDTARHAFAALADHDLLAPALADRLGLAVGMRNVLVHDYADVDLQKIAGAVANDLDDLRAFGSAMAALIDQP